MHMPVPGQHSQSLATTRWTPISTKFHLGNLAKNQTKSYKPMQTNGHRHSNVQDSLGNKFQTKSVDNINYKISLPMCLAWQRLVSQTPNKFRTKFENISKFGQFCSFYFCGFLFREPMANWVASIWHSINSICAELSELLHCIVIAEISFPDSVPFCIEIT